jgi:hypothetical protein
MGPMVIPQKARSDTYTELVIFHPCDPLCDVLHSCTSRVQNIDALFFMLSGPDTDTTKSVSGYVVPNFCFCIPCDLLVTYRMSIGHREWAASWAPAPLIPHLHF